VELVNETAQFKPRYILNGFPKSGLHLASSFMGGVMNLAPDSEIWGKQGWTGTFKGRSWTNERIRPEVTCYKLARMHDGEYMIGHIGHSPEVEQFLYYFGAAHVLIIRDFRDVAVSQAYHVTGGDKFAHPDKELYRSLEGFDKVLLAVIEGIGEYPGIFERWEQYAPWLDVEWSEVLTFEEMRYKPYQAAEKLVAFGYGRLGQVMNANIVASKEGFQPFIEKMVESSQQRDTQTFRVGVSGSWKEAFTDEITQAFKRADKNNWLVRLGYEKDQNWEAKR
jgi:hypothetical protein